MRKKTWQLRSISFLLSFCMLLQLAPAAEGNAGEDEIKQVIDFVPAGLTGYDAATLEEHSWAVNQSETSPEVFANTNTVYYREGSFKVGLQPEHKLALDIRVERSGTYDVRLAMERHRGVGLVAAVSMDGHALGSFNSDVAEVSGINPAYEALRKIKLDAGDHKLEIKCVSAQDANRAIWLKKLQLTPAAEPEPELGPDAEIPQDQTIDFAIRGDTKYSDASLSAHGWSVNTEATSPGVLAHEGTLLYPESGMAAVFANGEELVFDIRLAHGGTYDIAAEIEQYQEFGLVGEISIDGTSLGNISWTDLEDETVINNSLLVQLQRMTLEAGDHKLKIRRVNEGTYRHHKLWLHKIIFTAVDVPVDPQPQVINFVPAGLTSYDAATLEEHNWAVNQSETSPEVFANTNTVYYREGSFKVGLQPEHKLALDIRVERSGTYDVRLAMERHRGAGLVAAVSMDGRALGSFNSDVAEVPNVNPAYEALRKIKLDAGDHKLEIKCVSAQDANRAIWLKELQLTPAAEPEPELGPDAEIPQDQTIDFAIRGDRTYKDASLSAHGWSVNTEATSPEVLAHVETKLYPESGMAAALAKNGEELVFDIRLAHGGTYDIAAEIEQYQEFGLVGEISIDGTSLGNISWTDLEDETVINNSLLVQLQRMTLEAGDHKLKIRRVNEGTYRHHKLWLHKVIFTAVDVSPDKPEAFTLTADRSVFRLKAGGNAAAELSAKLGEEAIDLGAEGNEVEIIANDQAVADVSLEHRDGKSYAVISAKAAGGTEIRLNAKLASGETASTTLLVIADAENAISLQVEKMGAMQPGSDARLAITACNGGLAIPLGNASITAVSSEPSIISAEAVVEKQRAFLELYAKEEGTAEIELTARIGGMDVVTRISIIVDVNAQGTAVYTLNFKHSLTSPNVATLEEHGFKINQEATTPEILTRTDNYSVTALDGLKADMRNAGEVVVIDVKIPKTGTYDLTLNGRYYQMFGIVGGIYLDGKYLGKANFSSPDELGEFTDFQQELNSIEITEGVHSLTIKRMNTGDYRHCYFWLGSISFEEAVEFPEISGIKLECDRDSLIVGESMAIRSQIIMTNGRTYHFSSESDENSFTLQNKSPDTLRLIGNETIQALAPGIGELEAQVVVEGKSHTARLFLPVTFGKCLDFTAYALDNPEAANLAEHGWQVNVARTSQAIRDRVWNYAVRTGENGFLQANFNPGEVLGVDFEVEQSGAYSLSAELYQVGNFGAYIGVYVDGVFVGDMNFSHPSDSDSDSVWNSRVVRTLNSIELSEGRHTLLFKRLNTGYRHNCIYIQTLTLENVGTLPGLQEIQISSDSHIKLNAQAQVNIQAVTEDGRPIRFGPLFDGSEDSENSLSITSSDPSVIRIDENGKMTALKIGNADIIATVKIRGKEYTEKKNIEVVHDFRLYTLPAALEVERELTESAELRATLDGADVQISQAEELSVVVSDPEIADVTVIREEGRVRFQYTGKKPGTTSIQVQISLNGVRGTVQIPLLVLIPRASSENIFLNFLDGAVSSPVSAEYMANGWETNTELSSESIFKNGEYSITSLSGLKIPLGYDDVCAIDFRVSKTGFYAMEINANQYGNFGCLAAFYVDGEYMGDFDFSHPSDAADEKVNNLFVKKKFNSLHLYSGRHTLLVRRINSTNYRHNTVWLNSLTLHSLAQEPVFDRIELKADKTVLSVGERGSLSAEAVISNELADGTYLETPYRFERGEGIQISNGNPDAIRLENGSFTACGKGNAQLQAQAVVWGETKTASLDITVDGQKLSSLVLSLDKGSVSVGESANLVITPAMEDGRPVDPEDTNITVVCETPDILDIEGNTVTGLRVGEGRIRVSAELNGTAVTNTLQVPVTSDGLSRIEVIAIPRVIAEDSKGTQINVRGKTYSGEDYSLDGVEIAYQSMNTSVANVSDSGFVTPVAKGSTEVQVTVQQGKNRYTGKITILVGKGKTESSYYRKDRVEAIRENSEKYNWARAQQQAMIATAEPYIGKEEYLWSMVTTQELPRSTIVGYRRDPEGYVCRYCGEELYSRYGNEPWIRDEFNTPWKLQCPECRRRFPSNDFWSFYKLGIEENGGNWSYEKAKAENAKLVAEGQDGYLKNILYPEKDEHIDPVTGKLVNEGIHNWGVDDGYGYRTGEYYLDTSTGNAWEKVHTYIACYNHYQFQSGIIGQGIKHLRNAYVYTGDPKYGRVGAILIDRMADVYPDMYTRDTYPLFSNTDSQRPKGKIVGSIWAYWLGVFMPSAYDAFYPMMEDPYVINFLSKKAERYNMLNPKDSPEAIRQNCEDGILREVFKACETSNIYGNFGMHQSAAVFAGVVLDTMPETKEMIDWAFRSAEKGAGEGLPGLDELNGGFVLETLIKDIERDGGTGEAAPNYDNLWIGSVETIMDALEGYQGYPDMDLYKNPRVVKLMKNLYPLTLCRRTTAAMGDSGATADKNIMISQNVQIKLFQNTKDPEAAQIIYFLNGNSTKGLHYPENVKNPEKLQTEIQQVIDEYGEYDFDRSELMTGYGFGILRDGSLYAPGALTERNTQRDFWLGFSKTGVHGHPSKLNLGIDAYGIDIAPELGYPTRGDGSDEQRNYGFSTISHNTVQVDDTKQLNSSTSGTPLHFDDAGRVKVIDVDAADAYRNTDIYRRTVVMVEASDEVSYGVDFFRVKGGDEHLYSFHSQSDEIGEYQGFKPIQQNGGSYAGASIPFQSTGVASGYTYFRNVRKARNPGTGEFMVDFNVKDFRKLGKDTDDIHLRMTMLNDFNLSEISLVTAEPPKRDGNPAELEYVFARRSGKNLDTLFTTVFEPYKGERYLESMTAVDVARADGKPVSAGEGVKAVKVVFTSGRIDYVIYAADNTVEYSVDNGLFNFQGFVGVYTLMDGENAYSYLCDGSKLGDMEATAAYNGTVVDFTKDLSFENQITVRFDGEIDLAELPGRYLRVQNSSARNAGYQIKGAQDAGNGLVVLDIGDQSPVESVKDATDMDALKYNYNIAPRQWLTVPLSAQEDSGPVFEPVGRIMQTAGKAMSLTISAESPAGKELTYSASVLPRGAQFDPETQSLKWTPDSSQIGEHSVAITATDGVFYETLTITIEVVKSAGGNGTATQEKPPVVDPPVVDPPVVDPPVINPPEEEERFHDLGGYDWAKDAINALAEEGIIRGTGPDTFSPGKNITRADFAILLTRAFELEGDTEENFIDVPKSAYYAPELAVAKACGVVEGIGGGKFDPEGEISRQDMMVMLYRALVRTGYALEETQAGALAGFSDGAQVSEYAQAAVASLITNGIIEGANGLLRPHARSSRAEVAVTLWRVLN